MAGAATAPSARQTLTSDDPLHPWPRAYLVPVAVAADFLGVTMSWLKRAKADGWIESVTLRNTSCIRAAELYRVVEENTRPSVPQRPVTRHRTPEHNAKIGAGVSRAKRSSAAAKKSRK